MATDSTASETILDVREIDGPPFDDIAAALEELPADGRLHLIAPFEPEPLYEVLETRGFEHEIERSETSEGASGDAASRETERRDDVWHVVIEHA
ncbi:hypothetical protein C477_15415 [Haloterrigena salina JCM 13891]|uniref:DUF2249 domain-containing protein n=1 Tax=Haloterrigena salina JCM 13891 TaxID=1227488 RepID=M0C184_9EURY|nr:DUF2249 domain-containing protein [Haloterrigena salina]ELZ16433.1 hypothetical protein C477_15415 [Haloterrigena salina JCM 13891]